MLALVVVMVYGYWFMTNDARVRDQAQQYLQSLTGGRVKIRKASFRLFEGIRLEGVTMYLPKGDSPDPFFTARTVILKHSPWSLFAGKLQPTNLLCLYPVLTLEYYPGGKVNIQQLQPLLEASASPSEAPPELPSVQLRDGIVRIVKVDGSLRQTKEKHIDMAVIPHGRESCLFAFEEQRKGEGKVIESSVTLLPNGKKIVKGSLPIEDMFDALPQPYAEWLKQYGVHGSIKYNGELPANQSGTWEVDLVDASMALPALQGGLAMEQVNGKLLVRPSGVTVQKLRGRIPQAGDAWFELNGEYSGFAADSPFKIQLESRGVDIPSHDRLSGAMAWWLRDFEKKCRLEGKADLTLLVQRSAKGPVSISGQVRPKDMAVTLGLFPYKLERVRGTIDFDSRKVEFTDIKAVHGQGTISMSGNMLLNQAEPVYDLTIETTELGLDNDFGSALPRDAKRIWKSLSPGGVADLTAHLWRKKRDRRDNMALTLKLDGRASMKYVEFPYPVSELMGVVLIENDNVTIKSVNGQQGPMWCNIKGTIKNAGSAKYSVDMNVLTTNMPFDAKFAHALGKGGADMMTALHPEGEANRITVHLTQPPGKPLDYTAQVRLEDVTVTPKACPYRLEHAKGTLTVTPKSVVILDEIVGVHGSNRVGTKGRVDLGGPQMGIDLTITAPGLVLDHDLFEALPAAARRTWKQLSPSGKADLELNILQDAKTGDFSYTAAICPRGMEITYAEFPYTFRGVNGKVVAKPGLIDIKEMTSAWGKSSATISGTVKSDAKSDNAVVAVEAKNLPIDQALLKAMPGELDALRGRLKPGGTVDVSFSRMTLARTDRAPTTRAGTMPSPRSMGVPPMSGAEQQQKKQQQDMGKMPMLQPATQPSERLYDLAWSVDGTVGFKNAVLDIGQDNKALTGKVYGTASRAPEGLKVDAKFDLDTLQVGPREITELHGQVSKAAKSPLIRMEDVAGKAYGGLVAGTVQVKLVDPLEYGIRIDVKDVDLGELLNAGVVAPAEKSALAGKLTGSVQYSFKPKGQPAQQATGQLIITQGKIGKLPVMLDLMHVLSLSLPGQSAFTDGSLTYTLKDDKLVLTEIHFWGPGMSILGSGTMDTKTEKLDLTFLSSPGGKLPRLGAVTELLEGVSRELTEVRITGTVKAPKTTTVQFKSLKGVIDTLLEPEKKANEDN